MGRHCEVDLPVLKKFLFCLPLRPGLIAYGFLQLLATLGIFIFSIIDFTDRMLSYRFGYGAPAIMTLIFVACIIYSLVDIFICLFLMWSVHKKNSNVLELCFHYQKYKVMLYAILLIVCFFITVAAYRSYDFFYYHFDAVRGFMLHDNLAVGVLDWILQFYVVLVIRSELLSQQHVVDLPTLYGRLRPPTTIIEADEPRKEPLPPYQEGYIQYH